MESVCEVIDVKVKQLFTGINLLVHAIFSYQCIVTLTFKCLNPVNRFNLNRFYNKIHLKINKLLGLNHVRSHFIDSIK